MSVEELQKSRRQIINPNIRDKVEQKVKKYFGKEMQIVKKEEVIKFMRYYADEVPGN